MNESKNIYCKKDIWRSTWRVKYEGALYYILSFGNELKNFLYDDQDHLSFSKTNGEMSEQFEMDIFKYVLMGNHYHL